MSSYFQSYKDYFWQWEDSNEVLAIPKGNTIAYKVFLIETLEKLADQGLPPFGSVLLALIATNPSAQEDIPFIYRTLNDQLSKTQPSKKENCDILFTAMKFLNTLVELPNEYKSKTKLLQLLQTLFDKCHNINGIKLSRGILKSYKNKTQLSLQVALKEERNAHIFYQDFRTIALLANRFPDAESILKKMAQLPELPDQLLQIEEAPSAESQPVDFIQELIEHPKTFQVGALIKRIWSGLHIPFHNTLPSHQPMGGFSDITNKGDISRLLISEFANDDTLLLLRLANQEALYLNREMPPITNEMERIILIDISLLNWGTPKCIAFALMIAIAKHPKTDIKCRAYAVGTSYQPIDFGTIHELIESLQVVEACLHPAAGLTEFCKKEPIPERAELFLISTAETMQLPAVQKTLAYLKYPLHYWIYTDNEGGIDIFKKQNLSKKHVQTLHLPLNSLWEKPPKPLKKEVIPQHTATVMGVLPILTNGSHNPKKILMINGSIFQVTQDRNVLKFTGENKGWQLVYEQLPFISGEFEMGLLNDGTYALLMFSMQDKNLTLLNLSTGQKISAFFTGWKSGGIQSLIFHEQCFYFLSPNYRNRSWKIEVEPEIKITKTDDLPTNLKEVHAERQESIQKKIQSIHRNGGLLTNIKQVFITELGELVFNNHKLSIDRNGYIQFEFKVVTALNKVHVASDHGFKQFKFNNGSTISLHSVGMLVFRSAQDSRSYQIVLKNAGQKRDLLTRNIQEILDVGPMAAAQLIETQGVLKSGLSMEEAEAYRIRFKRDTEYDCEIILKMSEEHAIYVPTQLQSSIGIATQKEFAGNLYYLPEETENQLQIIKTDIFWSKHIESFIKEITAHGTKA